ncbi:hypothetical protein D3C72_2535080 [compost metagenome]
MPTTVIRTEIPRDLRNGLEVTTNFMVFSWKSTGKSPTFPEITAHSALTALENTLANGSSVDKAKSRSMR